MAIKVAKLWKDARFTEYPHITKLLYIYLATNPDLNSVGVLSPNLDVMCIELGISMDELRWSTQNLIHGKYIYVKKFEDITYFILPNHFSTLPKSSTMVNKVNQELSTFPDELVLFLDSIGIKSGAKMRKFIKPTAQEVESYALSIGHRISGNEFVSYYDDQTDRYGKKDIWVDGRGQEVKSWKQKLERIWCKDENKIPKISGAPEGFESFYVKTDNGIVIFPEKWKDGLPWAQSIGDDTLLKKHFKKLKS